MFDAHKVVSPTATLIRDFPSDTKPGAGGLILINSRFDRKSQEIFAIAAWSQAANVFRLREIAVQLLKQQRAILRTRFSRIFRMASSYEAIWRT